MEQISLGEKKRKEKNRKKERKGQDVTHKESNGTWHTLNTAKRSTGTGTKGTTPSWTVTASKISRV